MPISRTGYSRPFLLKTNPRRKARFAWRVGLVPALIVICLMGGMVVAQAAGVDVFGAIARWTDEVFSLGTIRSDGAVDRTSGNVSGGEATGSNNEANYASLQESLDDYGITEFSEPTWVPEGYALESVKVDRWVDDGSFIALYAKYYNGTNFLQIKIERYQGNANEQLEKAETTVESFAIGGLTIYLLENLTATLRHG